MHKKYNKDYNYNFNLIKNNENGEIILVIFKNKLNKEKYYFKIENDSLIIYDNSYYIEFNNLEDTMLNELINVEYLKIIEINEYNLQEEPLFFEIKKAT